MSDGVAVLTRFARALRDEGVAVGTDRVVSFCRAAALLEPMDLYWAGRATLVGHPRDIATYDSVFGAFFGGMAASGGALGTRVQVTGAIERDVEVGIASTIELLREKSFDSCSPEELAELAASMARLPPLVPLRRSRRREPGARGVPDLRRTLRRSFRTGGEPLERAWRERRRRPRRLILLLDVSGSMAEYSRALLMFAHVVLRSGSRWEAFCFGTRLTRVTTALATTDPDEALRRAAAEAFDWGGGTRIGESLKRFLDEFGHRGPARGAVVVICSDGLEVGEPELLEEQMARLARLAHRVVWVNPLTGDAAYEPLARGMRAALPHVDTFAAGHNLASLEALAATLAPTTRT
jgi:hypothetical protein